MVNYKAEAIEEEYVRRLYSEVLDDMEKMNVNDLKALPECIRVAILRFVAIEVVACRICRSAEWN